VSEALEALDTYHGSLATALTIDELRVKEALCHIM
jgi:hypothetical protein